MDKLPELKPIIIPKIEDDALIFQKSLETQFETLIFHPLLQLQQESLKEMRTIVFLVDGCRRMQWA